MITENKINLIKRYKQREKNFNKIINSNEINIKKTFLKSKTNILSNSLNFPELDKSFENSKILYENNEKHTPLILPSISDASFINKNSLNSSMNKKINNDIKQPIKLRRIRIKKTIDNKEQLIPFKQKKSLIHLYNENLRLKQRLEKYKIKKAENMGSFSYKKYNYNLVKYSSIDLSQDSVKAFKKNMETIENNMNGTFKRKNRWLVFLDKIGNFAPEGLKRKLKSLSESKYRKYKNNNNNISK